MIAKIAHNIVLRQIKQGILREDQKELYLYGYEIVINQCVNILIALIIAVLFSVELPVIIYMASYLCLRGYCGGYHARTNWGCIVVSAFVLIVVCMVVNLLKCYDTKWLQMLLILLTGMVIFILAPVADENRPYDEWEISRFQKRSRLIWVMEAFIWFLISFFSQEVSLVIALAHGMMSIILIIGKVKNTFFLHS